MIYCRSLHCARFKFNVKWIISHIKLWTQCDSNELNNVIVNVGVAERECNSINTNTKNKMLSVTFNSFVNYQKKILIMLLSTLWISYTYIEAYKEAVLIGVFVVVVLWSNISVPASNSQNIQTWVNLNRSAFDTKWSIDLFFFGRIR